MRSFLSFAISRFYSLFLAKLKRIPIYPFAPCTGLPGWKARRRGDALYVLIEGLGTVIGVRVPHLQPAPFKLSWILTTW